MSNNKKLKPKTKRDVNHIISVHNIKPLNRVPTVPDLDKAIEDLNGLFQDSTIFAAVDMADRCLTEVGLTPSGVIHINGDDNGEDNY